MKLYPSEEFRERDLTVSASQLEEFHRDPRRFKLTTFERMTRTGKTIKMMGDAEKWFKDNPGKTMAVISGSETRVIKDVTPEGERVDDE